MEADPGFWQELSQIWFDAIENEWSRGLIYGALGGVLAIPAQCLAIALKRVPAVVMTEGQRKLIVAGVCVFMGIVLAAADVIDQSHGVALGVTIATIVGVHKEKGDE